MKAPMNLSGRSAVVTGAGSGIGRAISLSLAKRGCHLILVDIDRAGAGATAEQARALGAQASVYRVDVGSETDIKTFAAEALAAHPKIDLLINNAGVALSGGFEQVSPEDFDWLININFWGVVRMTRAFLPRLRESDDARIVNLSSIFGIIAPPGQTAYCAAKFAVRGFSESLRHELESSSVGVTVVHPGGVATSIATSARAPRGESNAEAEARHQAVKKMLTLPPEIAGETIVNGIISRRPRVLVGDDAKQVVMLERLMPVGYWNVVQKRMGWGRRD